MPTHYKEWEGVQSFRQKYAFEEHALAHPNQWTFNHPDHHHIVLYQGIDIIGYAHLQLWEDRRGALHIILIDSHLRTHELRHQFLNLLEQ